ncbi:hypothetical protein ACFE04_008537 [Oxalis oulophora]
MESVNLNGDDNDEDRLTSLPNHLSHHILSFLTIEQIVTLSLVSRKCQNLCLTDPILTIEDSSKNGDECPPKRVHFLDYLVTFIKRRKCAKLTNLVLSWGITGLPFKETVRVMWLLNHAMLCNVDCVALELDFGKFPFLIPLQVFWTESLTSLAIYMCNGYLEFPTPYGFSHLKHLLINRAVINNDSLGEWISSVCKCLQKLWLTEIYEMDIFKISSQSLQELEIESCNLDYLEISAQSLKTLNLIKALDLSNSSYCNVYAPNLLILACSGNCIEYLTLQKTESKYSASLILPEAYLSKTDELKSLLSSLVQVTELSIDHMSLQGLYDNNCLPFPFINLQSVRLHNGFENISVPAIGHFLQGLSHNLKKLHMDHYLGAEADIEILDATRFDLKFWESFNFSFVHGLEEMELDIHEGNFEEGLVDFLLKNAIKLKKLTISSKHSIPTKLAHYLIAFVETSRHRAKFSSQGNKIAFGN